MVKNIHKNARVDKSIIPWQLDVNKHSVSNVISIYISVLVFFLHQYNKHGDQGEYCKNQHQPGDSMNGKIK